MRNNDQENLMWIERQSKLWLEDEKEWKHCLKLHLQFGHGTYSKIETMLNKALRDDPTFNKYKKERLNVLKKSVTNAQCVLSMGEHLADLL